MRVIIMVFALLYTFFTFTLINTDAQVNFSPAWGKRSSDILGQDAQDLTSEFRRLTHADGCQTPLECLLRMQRLLRQKDPTVDQM